MILGQSREAPGSTALTLTVERFRQIVSEEVRSATPDFGWLEGWLHAAPQPTPGRARPLWSQEGRSFRDFPSTLLSVLRWYKPHKHTAFRDLGWTPSTEIAELVSGYLTRLLHEASRECTDSEVANALMGIDPSLLGRYTAIDYRFQTLTDRPIRTVLDFGAGFGRQAWPWLQRGAKVIAVDAIEVFYLLQYEVFRRLHGSRFFEYCTDSDACRRVLGVGREDAIVHLPTWRLDLVPDRSVDLVISVQVLQELSEPTLRHVLAQFTRVISAGGLLYIRDDEFWMPSHKVRVGRALLEQGWRLVFRYPGEIGTEIAGIPRVWMFTGEDTRRYFRWRARLKRAFLPSYARSFRSWRDLGLPI